MTTPTLYRKAIANNRKFDALSLYRSDLPLLVAYDQLTEKEQIAVDLLVDLALESL